MSVVEAVPVKVSPLTFKDRQGNDEQDSAEPHHVALPEVTLGDTG